MTLYPETKCKCMVRVQGFKLTERDFSSQVAGLLASLERSVGDAEVKGNGFFVTIVEKQHQRLKSVLERFIVIIIFLTPGRALLTFPLSRTNKSGILSRQG